VRERERERARERERERKRESKKERFRFEHSEREREGGRARGREREGEREGERGRRKIKRTNEQNKKRKKERGGGEKTGLPGSTPSSSTRYAPSRKAQFVSTSCNAHIEYTHTNRVKTESEYQVCAEDEGALCEHLLQCAHKAHTYNHRGYLL